MDYSKLSNRELDAAIAERVMGWKLEATMWQIGPADSIFLEHWNPSTDDNAARMVSARIAELGLADDFLQILRVELIRGGKAALTAMSFMQATARQQAIAALETLDTSGRKAE